MSAFLSEIILHKLSWMEKLFFCFFLKILLTRWLSSAEYTARPYCVTTHLREKYQDEGSTNSPDRVSQLLFENENAEEHHEDQQGRVCSQPFHGHDVKHGPWLLLLLFQIIIDELHQVSNVDFQAE